MSVVLLLNGNFLCKETQMPELHLSIFIDDFDFAAEYFEHLQDAYASMRQDEL